jgi:hypothetical protein
VQSCSLGLLQSVPLFAQLLSKLFGAFARPKHPDIANGGSQQQGKPLTVTRQAVSHHHNGSALIQTHLPPQLFRYKTHAFWKSLGGEKKITVIYDGHLPAQQRGHLSERNGIVPGSAECQMNRRLHWLDQKRNFGAGIGQGKRLHTCPTLLQSGLERRQECRNQGGGVPFPTLYFGSAPHQPLSHDEGMLSLCPKNSREDACTPFVLAFQQKL